MGVMDILDRPIAYQPIFVHLGAGVTGAIFLSQAIYWSKRTNSSAWFYKTQQEWEQETGLTRREQESARRKLREAGIIEEKKQGVPCRVFFRVNQEALSQFVQKRQTSMAESAKLECTKTPNSDGGKRQTKTETTTETTTEINSLVSTGVETGVKKSNRKPDYIREIWNQYPEHRRGGTDQQLWKKWKSLRLTESDANSVLSYLAKANQVWSANPRFVPGITRFIDEQRWKGPLPESGAPVGSAPINWDDTSWADGFNPHEEAF